MNMRRLRTQEAVAARKGRGNLEQFKEGDSVRVCNIKKGVWDLKGVISKELPGEDGKVRTYEILLDDGTCRSWTSRPGMGSSHLSRGHSLRRPRCVEPNAPHASYSIPLQPQQNNPHASNVKTNGIGKA